MVTHGGAEPKLWLRRGRSGFDLAKRVESERSRDDRMLTQGGTEEEHGGTKSREWSGLGRCVTRGGLEWQRH